MQGVHQCPHVPLNLSKKQVSTGSQQPPSSTSAGSSHMELPRAATVPQAASSSLFSPHFLHPFARTKVGVGSCCWGSEELASREMKGNVHRAEIYPMYQLLPLSPFPQVLLLARLSPILPPAPLCSHCHCTHQENICCSGSERLVQPACKGREQNELLFSTFMPIMTVPIAWYEPSWAVVPPSTQRQGLIIIASAELSQACGMGPGEVGGG